MGDRWEFYVTLLFHIQIAYGYLCIYLDIFANLALNHFWKNCGLKFQLT